MSKYLKAISQARNTKLCSILPKDRKARFEIWVLRSSEFCISTAPLTDWATNGTPLDGISSGKSWWGNVSPYSVAPFTSLSMPYYIIWCIWPQTWVWTPTCVFKFHTYLQKIDPCLHLGPGVSTLVSWSSFRRMNLGHSRHRLRAFGRIFLV